jgi:sortase (surface protein transpeptidase)
VATSTTTLPLSPFSASLGEAISVIPEPPAQQTPPTAIAIEEIDLDLTPVRPVGVDADGQLEIPNETEVGWYRHGSWPGQPGATVLAAHVSWNDQVGPFYRLLDLEPGATIAVQLADGSLRRYAVVERVQYPKSELPADRVWTRSGPETLVLVTCGGDFNPDIRRYRHNIVVYAAPAT